MCSYFYLYIFARVCVCVKYIIMFKIFRVCMGYTCCGCMYMDESSLLRM